MKTEWENEGARGKESRWRPRLLLARPTLLVSRCAGCRRGSDTLPALTPRVLDRMNRLATYLRAASILKNQSFGGSHDDRA